VWADDPENLMRSQHCGLLPCLQVDTMIVQAIGLLDELDKDLNTYAMRVREWYGWHFPEMTKIVSDNITYAKTVRLSPGRPVLVAACMLSRQAGRQADRQTDRHATCPPLAASKVEGQRCAVWQWAALQTGNAGEVHGHTGGGGGPGFLGYPGGGG
jgi:snoRNA binding domain, fibrillarin